MKRYLEEIAIGAVFVAALFGLFHSYKTLYPPEYYECLQLAEESNAVEFSYNAFSGCSIEVNECTQFDMYGNCLER